MINGGRLTGWKTRGRSSGAGREARGGWNRAPISEVARDSEKWRRLEGAGRGHLGAFTPCTRYTHPCLRVRGRTYTRDLQSAVHCRGCIHGGEKERELSSGYLIARVNKFTHTFFLVQCCESLILFLYAEREKIYDVYFKISSRLYYS